MLTPRDAARAAELPRSKMNCAASAAAKSGQCRRQSGETLPAATSTSAGPSACHPFETRTIARSRCHSPRMLSGTLASRNPAATSSGARLGGTRKSIGTKTSCVGIA